MTGRVWIRAVPSRTSSSRRGPTPRKEYRPRRSPPSTDSSRYAGPPSSSRRKAPIGVSRSAGRVARSRIVSALAARRWACARLIGSAVVIAGCLGESRTTVRLRDERSCLPRCHPHSAMPHSRDRRVGWRGFETPTAADRRCPVSLALCAGAYWRPRPAPPRVRSGGSRVHSLSSSLRLAPTAGSLDRRATGTRPVHSPLIRDVRGVCRRSAEASSGTRERLEAIASQHRQRWVARIARVRRRAFAQPEDGATGRNDATGMPTRPAQARRRAGSLTGSSSSRIRTWRRGWDSNPRSLSTQRFSRAPPSTARPPLRA